MNEKSTPSIDEVLFSGSPSWPRTNDAYCQKYDRLARLKTSPQREYAKHKTRVLLGFREALKLPCEPKLTETCTFAASFKPAKIFLGYLYEVDREPDSMWTDNHTALDEKSKKNSFPKGGCYTPDWEGVWLLIKRYSNSELYH